MQSLINIVKSNSNIQYNLKNKIFYCIDLILKKYPEAYQNLKTNLSKITIRYSNESDINFNKLQLKSLYDYRNDLLLIKNTDDFKEKYPSIIIEALLQISSYDRKNNFGFENLYLKGGRSLNSGMLLYLKGIILGNDVLNTNIYKNDLNNIMFFMNFFSSNQLINIYFNEGMNGLYNLYLSLFNKENFYNIILNMDYDFIERREHKIFSNKYKNTYIKLLLEDISNINFETEEECLSIIKKINFFIRGQYNNKVIPDEMINYVEKITNKIYNKVELKKGKI